MRSHSAGRNLVGSPRLSPFFTFHNLFVRCDESSTEGEAEYILFALQTHVGVGNPLSPERTRMLLALRINVLAKGYSGISLETLHAMIQAFNGNAQNTQVTFTQVKYLLSQSESFQNNQTDKCSCNG